MPGNRLWIDEWMSEDNDWQMKTVEHIFSLANSIFLLFQGISFRGNTHNSSRTHKPIKLPQNRRLVKS